MPNPKKIYDSIPMRNASIDKIKKSPLFKEISKDTTPKTKYGIKEILKSNSPKKPSTSDSLQVHAGRKHPEWAQDAKKIEKKFGKLDLSNFNAKKALKRLGY
jgi:hypothetical protein